MLDKLRQQYLGGDDSEQQLEAEHRNMNFIREQDTVNAVINDDGSYHQMQADKQDLTRWQQDLDDSIERLRHTLMNEFFDGKAWKKKTYLAGYDEDDNAVYREVPPMINEVGCHTLISVVEAHLTRNAMMSNLSEEIIFRMLRRLNEVLVENMGMCKEMYNIDNSTMSLIKKTILNVIEQTLYRALNNGERNYLNTINKRIEAFSTGVANAPPKKGLLGGM